MEQNIWQEHYQRAAGDGERVAQWRLLNLAEKMVLIQCERRSRGVLGDGRGQHRTRGESCLMLPGVRGAREGGERGREIERGREMIG